MTSALGPLGPHGKPSQASGQLSCQELLAHSGDEGLVADVPSWSLGVQMGCWWRLTWSSWGHCTPVSMAVRIIGEGVWAQSQAIRAAPVLPRFSFVMRLEKDGVLVWRQGVMAMGPFGSLSWAPLGSSSRTRPPGETEAKAQRWGPRAATWRCPR